MSIWLGPAVPCVRATDGTHVDRWTERGRMRGDRNAYSYLVLIMKHYKIL